jgi:large subunit ribosomal protein L18
LIDDAKGITIVGMSDIKNTKKCSKTEKAKDLGTEIAKKALELKIEECVFDRNGYKYTGRIKALADAARAAGLKF